MTAPLLALSLSNTVLKVGALAAFAALLGIAVLSLLVFSQARELKRLREWAGRAPERAAELEQRVSAEAAARVQRVVPARAVGVTAAGAPIPRTTPVVARAATPVTGQSAAVGVVGGVPPGAPTGGPTVPGSGGLPGAPAGAPGAVPVAQPRPGQSSPGQPSRDPSPGEPVAQPAAPVPGQPAFVATGQSAPVAPAERAGIVAEPAAEDKQDASSAGSAETRPEVGLAPAAAAVASAATAGRVAPSASALTESEQPQEISGTPTPTPATAAARATVPGGRAPAPPAPVQGGALAPPRTARPAAPARPGASQGARGMPGAPGGAGAARPAAGRGGHVQGPPFLQEERSAGRTTALIVGGVLVGVAVLVGVLLSLGGGGSNPSKTTSSSASRSASSGSHARGSRHSHSHVAASPAETHVVVLNGTETTGLAHRISANLQQSGYTQSAALDARPAGRSTSVVEYAGGHSTEARHVAQTLGIAQVQPLESAVTPLAEGATVVVIAGADQAALGGETSGSSEATGASASGEASGAAQ